MRSSSNPKFTKAVLLQQAAREFVGRGGDIEAVMARNGIPQAAMQDPNHLVEATAFYAALDDMAALLKDNCFGAGLARASARSGGPTVRSSIKGARTLGDFLIATTLDVDLQFDNVVYSLRIGPELAVFQVHRTRHVERPTIQADAIGVVFFTSMIEACLGPAFDASKLLVVAHSFDGLPEGFLPAHVLMRSKDIALSISFPPAWLRLPLHVDWETEDTSGYSISDAPQTDTFPTIIRDLMRQRLSFRDDTLADLAAAIGLGTRSLQRLLTEAGTSFRAMRDDLRAEAAATLVQGTDLPFKEIASRTGFSDAAAFGRSYRRWTGMSPGAHRRSAAG